MPYMANDPPKIIPSNHQDNNKIFNIGTTGHFIQANSVCMNQKVTNSPLSVSLTDGSKIQSKHTNILSLLTLLEPARRSHLFPELKSVSLQSVSQLCDKGCKVDFIDDQVSFTLGNQTILIGPRNSNTGLWIFPLNTPSPPQPKPCVPPTPTCHYTHIIPQVQTPAVIHQAAKNTFATKNKQELVA